MAASVTPATMLLNGIPNSDARPRGGASIGGVGEPHEFLNSTVSSVDGADDRGGETTRIEPAPAAAVVSTLVVSPFVHHGRFRSFLTALEQRPGVLSVRPGRVRAGAVWLTVHHADGVPLLPLLQSLTEFDPHIEPGGGGRWLVRLKDESDDEL